MERLNKKQKEILTKASKKFPTSIPSTDISPKVGEAILKDLKLLEAKGLITADYTVGSSFPVSLAITPKGIEKLQENFKTRLIDTVHDNPLAVIAIIISVLSILANIYISIYTSQRTESLSIELNEVKKIAEYDTLFVRNLTSNATNNTIFIPCPNGTKPRMEFGDGGIRIRCIAR